jgi:hypothetical protein
MINLLWSEKIDLARLCGFCLTNKKPKTVSLQRFWLVLEFFGLKKFLTGGAEDYQNNH